MIVSEKVSGNYPTENLNACVRTQQSEEGSTMPRPSPKPFIIEIENGQTADITVRKGNKKLYTHQLNPGDKISLRVATDDTGGGDTTISPSKKP